MQEASYPPRQLTDVEIAWLAGLYEGEGTCYGTIKHLDRRFGSAKAYSTSTRVCIAMCDRDVIERIQELFPSPSNIRIRPPRGKGRKPQYEWRISRREHVAAFLRLILPHLLSRRTAQVRAVLELAEDPYGGLGSGHRNKTHCRNGHPYTEENTKVDKHGHRACRICYVRNYQRANARKRRKAHGASERG